MGLSVQEFQQVTWNGAPSVRVAHSVSQTAVTSTPLTLAFDTEVFDRWGMHDTASNNSRLMAQVSGIYTLGGLVNFVAAGGPTGGNFANLSINVNGSQVAVNQIRLAGGNVTYIFMVTTITPMAKGDFAELVVNHNSPSNSTVFKSGTVSPAFWAAWHSRA